MRECEIADCFCLAGTRDGPENCAGLASWFAGQHACRRRGQRARRGGTGQTLASVGEDYQQPG